MKRWQKLAVTSGVVLAAGAVGVRLATEKPAVEECDVGIYCDQYGLIVHRAADGSPDGGDTAQREGWYWLGVWLSRNTPGVKPWPVRRKLTFDQVLDLLEKDRNGVIYRHPFEKQWSNPFDKKAGTSRDQLVPLIAAMGVWGEQARLRRVWNALPEDLTGKHAFNGNWRNFLGQNGWDCTKIKQQSCSPTMDCSLKEDTRDCSLSKDDRSCEAQKSDADCSLHVDTRDCSACVVHNPLGGCLIRGNDPVCELSKATQNQLYASQKSQCEAAKAGSNILSDLKDKRICEAGKFGQNFLYAEQKAQCEGSKGAVNLGYAHAKAICEGVKTGKKYGCEAYKKALEQVCKIGNIHSGDLLGPEYINLFMRAMRRNPLLPQLDLWSPTIVQNGPAGEIELLANTNIRLYAAAQNRDDVGPDLNHIVMLIMSRIRYPTPWSATAVLEFSTLRSHSYGSYLTQYYATYGHVADNMAQRISDGISSQGWKPDVCAVFGAVKWYHREETGANPGLATMYGPLLNKYLSCRFPTPTIAANPNDIGIAPSPPKTTAPKMARLSPKRKTEQFRRRHRLSRGLKPRRTRRRAIPPLSVQPAPERGERG